MIDINCFFAFLKIKKKYFLALFLILIMCPTSLFADWQNYQEVINSSWGSGPSKFGFHQGDIIAYDEYPTLMSVTESDIVIHDSVNRRFAIYDLTGGNLRYENEKREPLPAGGYLVGRPNEKLTGWIKEDSKYVLYASSGEAVSTTSIRPLELGKLVVSPLSDTQRRYEVEYPDGIYVYEGAKDMLTEKEIVRVDSITVMENKGKKVYAYKVVEEIPAKEGEKKKYKLDKVAEWVKPEGQYIRKELDPDHPIGFELTIIAEYGNAVIGSDGSIYSWMRSATNYKILKWKWMP